MYDANEFELMELDNELRRANIPHEIFNIYDYEGLTYEELRWYADKALSQYRRVRI